MKKFDLSRLVAYKAGEVFAIAAKTMKTITGVADQAISVYVTLKGSSPVLYQAFPAGRFSFDIHCIDDVALFIEPTLVGSDCNISVLQGTYKTVVVGDPETMFTTVEHRPAINPELQAVLRSMQLMQGEMRSLRVQASRPKVSAAVKVVDPVIEPSEPVTLAPDPVVAPVVEPVV